MAKDNSTIAVPTERFNKATLKLSGASALIATIGILMGESSEIEVTGNLLAEAMNGICLLVDDAKQDLFASE